MAEIIRTDSNHPDFLMLVSRLDRYLAVTDGEEHEFYDQYNKLDKIKQVVIIFEDGRAVGCGALKEYEPGVMEVKRMYTVEEKRGKGYASMILAELEKWAAEMFCRKCILETGTRQPEAIALYKRNGYKLIPNYGQYAQAENSLCFEKQLGKG